jgi:two-component system chemotaxis sensor kinase CheA
VTSISGRGVGMDVVRANIEQIGGTVDLKSVPAPAPPSPSRFR